MALPSPPEDAPPFSATQWSDLRRALLSFAVVRGRGVLNLDGRAVRAAVAAAVCPAPQFFVPYYQRLAAYFWMQVCEVVVVCLLPPPLLLLLLFLFVFLFLFWGRGPVCAASITLVPSTPSPTPAQGHDGSG